MPGVESLTTRGICPLPVHAFMNSPSPRLLVFALVFAGGFASLGAELAASRLLDPWFGNSVLVWAVLIGLILFYLAIGSWWGGRLADRNPAPARFYTLAAVAGALLGLVPLVAQPVLRLAADVFLTYDLVALTVSFSASLVLFGAPVILMGCLSPFAVRLLVRNVEESGRTTGRVTALATTGSILGVFVPVLVLIPKLGTRRTFIALGLLLLGLAVAALVQARERRAVLFAILWVGLLALFLMPPGRIRADAATLYEGESAYNYIQVVRNGPEVVLKLNEGAGVHSVYRPGMTLADGIWDYFLVAPFFAPGRVRPNDVHSLLLIGLAAGTVPKLYTAAYGPIRIDGVELDPDVIEIGRRYFAMTEPNLRTIASDGRAFLRRASGPYDVIAVDAYRPPYIPFHLATVEFFQEAQSLLSPNGVVAVNVARTSGDYSLVDAVAASMEAVFPSVFIIDEPDQGFDLGNSLVIGTARPGKLDNYAANTNALSNPLLAEVARRSQGHVRIPSGRGPVLTDDRAPIEQIVHGIVLRYMWGSAQAP